MNKEYINDSDNESYKQHDGDEQRHSFGRPGELHDFNNDNLIDGWDY